MSLCTYSVIRTTGFLYACFFEIGINPFNASFSSESSLSVVVVCCRLLALDDGPFILERHSRYTRRHTLHNCCYIYYDLFMGLPFACLNPFVSY
jgi:hypothetical protein